MCPRSSQKPSPWSVAAGDRRIRAELHRIISRWGLGDRVRFTGFVPRAEFAALLMSHHLLMQPSVLAADGDSEGGHPVVLTQAAATGMPMIATRHCDIPEIVIDGGTGWLCNERNIDQLVSALLDALEHREKLVEYGRHARALVEEKYSACHQTPDVIYDRFV